MEYKSQPKSLNFKIQNVLNTEFVPSINVYSINLEPDNSNRILSVNLTYKIVDTQEIVNTKIFINAKTESNPKFTYTDIPDEGDNLYTFIQINKPNVPEGTLLEFSYTENYWVWYTFRFINFNFATDPRASDILILANGQ